jgi:hypothetical protein
MKLINYFLAMVEGSDGKLSIRRVMAFLVLFGLIRQVESCPENGDVCFVLASLIAALLALTTFQNMQKPKDEGQ